MRTRVRITSFDISLQCMQLNFSHNSTPCLTRPNMLHLLLADREQSDLEVILDEVLQCDFNVLADDDSPYQVSRSLVNMHNQVATGDYSYIEQLKATPVPMPEACRQVFAPEDEENDSSSSDEEEDGSGSDGMDVDDAMDEDQPTNNNNGPIIDEDGFQLVEKKGRGRR